MSWRQRLSLNLQRVTWFFCPKTHKNVSDYLVENYQTIKTLNPKFGFLIRDKVGHPRALLVAEYAGKHQEDAIDVTNLTEEQIDEALHKAVLRGGELRKTLPTAHKLPVGHPDVPIDILDLPEERQRKREQWEREHTATFK